TNNVLLIPNAALRFTPPSEDEQASKSKGNFLSQLMPRPPRDTKSRSRANENKNQPIVWILRDGQIIAIPVSTGSTNGIMTEVTSGGIKPGMAVIVSTMSSGR
ncbi:MAG: efflux RND transporter periplasmic adaptor subunit, partial [Gammaproteobacteria bacterium]